MTYRLPSRITATATCSSAGCDATASYGEGDHGGFRDAFHGWALGPVDAQCPQHVLRAAFVA